MAIDRYATCDKACMDAQVLAADMEYAIRLLSNVKYCDTIKRMGHQNDLRKTKRMLFSPSGRIKNEQVDDAYKNVTYISMDVGERLREARRVGDVNKEMELTDISRKLSHISTRLQPYSKSYMRARRKKQMLGAGGNPWSMAMKEMRRMGKAKTMCAKKVSKNVLKAMGAK